MRLESPEYSPKMLKVLTVPKYGETGRAWAKEGALETSSVSRRKRRLPVIQQD
jgi:hypothetical protein